MDEYYGSENVEELADLLELIYAIATHNGISKQELENIRDDKLKKRGGFEKRLFFISVNDL